MARFKRALKTIPDVTANPEMPGTPESKPNDSDNQLEMMKSAKKQQEFNNRVVEWTKNAYQMCRSTRQQVERQWYLNLAFIGGRQYVQTIPYSVGGGAGMGVKLWV